MSRALLGSLYPGAPFERKFLAMLLLNTLLAVWNTPDKAVRCSSPGIGQREGCLAGLLRAADAQGIHLLCPSFLGAKTVQASSLTLASYDCLRDVWAAPKLCLHAPIKHHP